MRPKHWISTGIGRLAASGVVALLPLFGAASHVLQSSPAEAAKIGETVSWDDGFDRSARDTAITEGEFVKPMLGVDTVEAMLAAIARYQIIDRRGGWPTIPGGHTLVIGSSDNRVKLLAHRLMIGGDLIPAKVSTKTSMARRFHKRSRCSRCAMDCCRTERSMPER